LWDVKTGRETLNLPGHTDWAVDVDFSPDGKSLATASFDDTVKVWNIAPGQEDLSVAGPGRQFAFVVFNPMGRFATWRRQLSDRLGCGRRASKLEPCGLVGCYSPDGNDWRLPASMRP
jgi:WD40 repeat protein